MIPTLQLGQFGRWLARVVATVVAGDWFLDNFSGSAPASSLVFLGHFDGANGATSYVDATGRHALTNIGNAALSTAQQRFGASSLKGDGSASAVTVSSDSDFAFGTGDFTLEAFVRASAADRTTPAALIDFRPAGVNGNYPTLRFDGTTPGSLIYEVNNIPRIVTTAVIVANTWQHVAVARSGTTTRLFVDGVIGGTWTDSVNYIQGMPRFLRNSGGSTPMSGYIDEVRIHKGLALYTATFTPPTAPFTTDGTLNEHAPDIGGAYTTAGGPLLTNMPLDGSGYLNASRAAVTWNPLYTGEDATLTDANKTWTMVTIGASIADNMSRATASKASGKYYFEILVNRVVSSQYPYIGVTDAAMPLNGAIGATGSSANSWGLRANGLLAHNGTLTATGSGTWATNDVIGIAWDATNGKIWFARNNVYVNSGNPSAGTNPAFTGVLGTLFPTVNGSDSTQPGPSVTGRWAPAEFTYAPPTGFGPWTNTGAVAQSIAAPSATPYSVKSRCQFSAVGSDAARLDVNVLAGLAVTWNPTDKAATVVLSGGNLTAAWVAGTGQGVRATVGKSSGKLYFEVRLNTVDGAVVSPVVGLSNVDWDLDVLPGAAPAQTWYLQINGFYREYPTSHSSGVTLVAGDVVQVAVDFAAGKMWFGKNNAWILSGNPASGASPASATVSGVLYPMVGVKGAANVTARFAASDFTYAPPAGFSAWASGPIARALLNWDGAAMTLNAWIYNAASTLLYDSGVLDVTSAFGAVAAVTWNPSDKGPDAALSNGNLTATYSPTISPSSSGVRATRGRSTGKYYFEARLDIVAAGNNTPAVGVANASWVLTPNCAAGGLGSWLIQAANGFGYNGSSGNAFIGTSTTGDILMFAIDFTAGKIWYGKNGTWFAGNPAAGTGATWSTITGTLFPACQVLGASPPTCTARFAASAFTYTPPSGFSAWDDGTASAPHDVELIVDAAATYLLLDNAVVASAISSGAMTWNPADRGASTLSAGDLTATTSSGSGAPTRATVSHTAGKYYYEVTIDALNAGSNSPGVGVATSALTGAGNGNWGDPGRSVYPAPTAFTNGPTSLGVPFSVGDVWGIAVDIDTGKIWFSRNGTYVLSGNPAAGTNPAATTTAGAAYTPTMKSSAIGCAVTARFDAASFIYAPPPGFSAWSGAVPDVLPIALAYSFSSDGAGTAGKLDYINGISTPTIPTLALAWNPLDKGAGITLSNSNRTAAGDATNLYGVRGTTSHSATGKYYFEVRIDALIGGATNVCIGIADASFVITSGADFAAGHAWGLRNYPAHAIGAGSLTPSGYTLSAGTVVRFWCDLATGKFWAGTDSTLLPPGADPVTGVNPYFSNVAGTVYPCVVCKNATVTARFAAAQWTYSPGAGFTEW